VVTGPVVDELVFARAVLGVSLQQRQRLELEAAALTLVDVHDVRLLTATNVGRRIVKQLVVPVCNKYCLLELHASEDTGARDYFQTEMGLNKE
jgi:hypothetical protein